MEDRVHRCARSLILTRILVLELVGLLLWSALSLSPGEDVDSRRNSVNIAQEIPRGEPQSAPSPDPKLAANSWVDPEPVPPFGYNRPMVYDGESDRVLIVVNEWPSRFELWAYDFAMNAWTEIHTLSLRPNLAFYVPLAWTYDSRSDRVLLLGSGAMGVETWSYDYNTNSWTNMTTSSKPPYLWGAVTYDSESDRAVYFGIHLLIGGGSLMETWVYDFNANAWANKTPLSGPPGGGPIAYDAGSDRVVLLLQESPGLTRTWTYDLNLNKWTDVAPPSGPTNSGVLAYDSESDRTILLSREAETWSYDLANDTWTNRTSGLEPPLRPPAGQGVAYDSVSDRIILFGGNWGQSNTWSYDYNSNRWEGLIIRPIWIGPMAYDSESDRIVMLADGTWAYDTNTNNWTEEQRASSWTYGVLGYDSESDRVILLGKSPDGSSGPSPQTWSYDYNTNTWTNMTTASAPPDAWAELTLWGAMTYDSESDRMIVFGTTAIQEGGLGETWAYDDNTNTWTNMTSSSGPSGRIGDAMAYDAGSDRVILFGGGLGILGCGDYLSPIGDTWAYDFNTNTWTEMSPPMSPAARMYHALAYDSDADRVILYGGCPDPYEQYFSSNDTWAYDFDTNTWTNLNPITNPGPRGDHAMAYDSESHLTVLFGGPSTDSPGPWWYRYPEGAPSSPRSLVAVAGNRQVALTWSSPSFDGGQSITGYRVYRFTWPTGLSIVATVGLVLTYADTGLTNGVLYYYWVSALNAIGEGTLSDTASATPRLTLSAPSNFEATAGIGQVVLAWQPVASPDDSPVTGYRVYRGTSDNYLAVIATLPSVFAYTDGNVTNGVTYYYRVSAMSGADEGPRSDAAAATPRETTEPFVVILSPTDGSTATSSSVVIAGTASDDTAVLKVELSRDGVDWAKASGTTSWSGSLTLEEGLNTVYARATDTSGNSKLVSVSVTVDTGVSITGILTSPLVVAVISIGVAVVVGAIVMRKWRSKS